MRRLLLPSLRAHWPLLAPHGGPCYGLVDESQVARSFLRPRPNALTSFDLEHWAEVTTVRVQAAIFVRPHPTGRPDVPKQSLQSVLPSRVTPRWEAARPSRTLDAFALH